MKPAFGMSCVTYWYCQLVTIRRVGVLVTVVRCWSVHQGLWVRFMFCMHGTSGFLHFPCAASFTHSYHLLAVLDFLFLKYCFDLCACRWDSSTANTPTKWKKQKMISVFLKCVNHWKPTLEEKRFAHQCHLLTLKSIKHFVIHAVENASDLPSLGTS